MNILIIEDEPATAIRLEKMVLQAAPDFKVLSVLDTVEDSISYFENHTQPDLVFMDIRLADGISFEIFEKTEVTCPVIFTTAYDQYAIKAFKVNSIDYLLKPVKREELVQSLNKFKQLSKQAVPAPDYSTIKELLATNKQNTIKRLMIKIGQTIKAIDITEVAYFYVENKIVYIVTNTDNRYTIDFTMDHLEQHLEKGKFFRVNRSFIIGFHSISSMTTWSKSRIKIDLEPKANSEVITSTERSGPFKDWLAGK